MLKDTLAKLLSPVNQAKIYQALDKNLQEAISKSMYTVILEDIKKKTSKISDSNGNKEKKLKDIARYNDLFLLDPNTSKHLSQNEKNILTTGYLKGANYFYGRHFNKEDVELAEEYLDKAMKIDPDNHSARALITEIGCYTRSDSFLGFN